MDGFFSANDVCRLFRISRKTLRQWEKQGEFPRRVRYQRRARGRVGFTMQMLSDWADARQGCRW